MVGQGALKFSNWGPANSAPARRLPRRARRHRPLRLCRPNVVLMPSFVNLGAYVAKVPGRHLGHRGSCAQIGKKVHLSGGVGIGGVLEPLQAGPVIIEDDCFIGAARKWLKALSFVAAACCPWACSSPPPQDHRPHHGRSVHRRSAAYSVVVPARCPASRCRTARPAPRSIAR